MLTESLLGFIFTPKEFLSISVSRNLFKVNAPQLAHFLHKKEDK